MFRSHNPAIKDNVFGPAQTWDDLAAKRGADGLPASDVDTRPSVMTVGGTITKTSILLGFCALTAMVTWNLAMSNPGLTTGLVLGGFVLSLLFVIVTTMKPAISPFTAPLVAICEGAFVGPISAFYAQRFAEEGGMLNTGLIINAVLLTFGVAFAVLAAYGSGVLRPGRLFRNVTVALTVGLVFYGIIAMVASMFMGSYSLISVYDPSNGGLVSIGFSVFVIILASANLVLDFQFVDEGVKAGSPKYLEWYGGFIILVALVWMYLEILRLLAKLQSRE